MVITLCSCDWGLGAPLPAHEHATMTLIRRPITVSTERSS